MLPGKATGQVGTIGIGGLGCWHFTLPPDVAVN
jgi:hypothetical protein